MKDIHDIATFRSGRFKPILPDTCQVTPGAYGAELAFWLAGKLARQGVVTSYPVGGDHGWALEYAAENHASFRILCANIDGSDTHWRIALVRSGAGLAGHAPSFDAARPLVNAIRFVLHGAVRAEDIDWRCDNEDCHACKQMPRM